MITPSFAWSGRNRNADRFEAEKRLAIQLRQQVCQYPTAKHYVIAHSHGTQVALYALRDPFFEGRIAGVVAMGSPFILSTPRDTGVFSQNFLGWFPIRLFVLLIGVAISSIFAGAWIEERGTMPPALKWLFDGLLFVPIVTLLLLASFTSCLNKLRDFCYRPIDRWISTSQQMTTQALGFDAITATPMLFITSAVDEAYWMLKVEGLISQLCVKGYVALSVLIWIFAAVAPFAFMIGFLAPLLHLPGESLMLLWAQSLVLIPLAAFVLALIEILFIPLMAVFAANGIAFGWDKISTYLWCRVGVYRKPEHCSSVSYEVVKLRPTRIFRLRRGLVGSLAHCAYYADTTCVTRIVAWLRCH